MGIQGLELWIEVVLTIVVSHKILILLFSHHSVTQSYLWIPSTKIKVITFGHPLSAVES